MTISITGFPASDPVPAIRLNVLLGQGTRSPGAGERRILMVGPRAYSHAGTVQGSLDATTTDGLAVYPIYSETTAADYWGYGSYLHLMARAIFANWRNAPLYAICAGKGTATQGTDTTALAGPASATATMIFKVCDTEYSLAITSGDSADTVGAAVAALINADPDIPVTAAYATPTLTIKAKNCGEDNVQIKWSTENLPSGITFTPANGTMDAGMTGLGYSTAYATAFALDTRWTYVVPATNTLSLITTATTGLKARIKANCTADVQKRMSAILGDTDATNTDALAFADGMDDETVTADEPGWRFQCVWAKGNLNLPWIVAACVAAQRGKATSGDINENWGGFAGKILDHVVAPDAASSWPSYTEVSQCINGGVTPCQYDSDSGTVTVVRSVTCKHLTSGADDYRARDTNVLDVSDYVAYGLAASIADEFDGFRIADDDSSGNPPANLAAKTTTPALIRQTIARLLVQDYESAGAIINVDDHLDELVVERNSSNSQRVDAEIPIEVARWLLQFGGNVREVGI